MQDIDDLDVRWTWRNCRSLSVGVSLYPAPWDWHLGYRPWDDQTYDEWRAWLHLGPVVLEVFAGIGHVSSESPWRARFGLGAQDAWNNAVRAARRRALQERMRASGVSRFNGWLMSLLLVAMLAALPAVAWFLGWVR